MTDRDLTPDQAHELALAIKWRERWDLLETSGAVLTAIGGIFVIFGAFCVDVGLLSAGAVDLIVGGTAWMIARNIKGEADQ